MSATPGPEADANGDPMVITRYLYKPTAVRRPDALQRQPAAPRLHRRRRVARGEAAHRRHLLRALARMVAGRRRDPVRVQPRAGSRSLLQLRRLHRRRRGRRDQPAHRTRRTRSTAQSGRRTASRSPISARRVALTSSETTMEDTHVWVMNADGGEPARGRRSHRQPPGGAALVARRPGDLLHRAGARDSHLYTIPADGRQPAASIGEAGSVGIVVDRRARRAMWPTRSRRRRRPAELFLRADAEPRTNADDAQRGAARAAESLGATESFTFTSFDGTSSRSVPHHAARLDRAPTASIR